MKYWQLQEAKAKLSEVVQQAIQHGPQTITLHGSPTVVLISNKEYQKLTKPSQSLVEFFQTSPLKQTPLNLTRDKSDDRDIEL